MRIRLLTQVRYDRTTETERNQAEDDADDGDDGAGDDADADTTTSNVEGVQVAVRSAARSPFRGRPTAPAPPPKGHSQSNAPGPSCILMLNP